MIRDGQIKLCAHLRCSCVFECIMALLSEHRIILAIEVVIIGLRGSCNAVSTLLTCMWTITVNHLELHGHYYKLMRNKEAVRDVLIPHVCVYSLSVCDPLGGAGLCRNG